MNILYLTNVPYGWIKQRPHFLAEYLSKDFDVTFFQQRFIENPFKKSVLVPDSFSETNMFRVFNYYLISNKRYIPQFFTKIVNYILLRCTSRKLRNNYDTIWFASPMVYRRLKFLVPKGKMIIYDCMDDYLEFPDTKKDIGKSQMIISEERELLNRAKLCFFSSDYLKKKVLSRYDMSMSSCMVINNAIELPRFDNMVISKLCDVIKNLENPYVYIGTISEWFDFSMVLKVLEHNKELNFVLVGPQLVPIPSHPRLHYLGPVDHDQVYSIIDASYALVMPFVVNELIRSVNPVKLYEYIYSGKPVVSVRYEETEKFRDYVYLYSDITEFDTIVDNIKRNVRTIDYLERCKEFAESNTWVKRCQLVNDALKEIEAEYS